MLAVAQRNFPANQLLRILGIELLGEIIQQDDFAGIGAREELALQIIECLVLARRHGQAGNEPEMSLAVIHDLAHHPDLGFDLGDVLQVRHLVAR